MHFSNLLAVSVATLSLTTRATPVAQPGGILRPGEKDPDAWRKLSYIPVHISYSEPTWKKKALDIIIADHDRVTIPAVRVGFHGTCSKDGFAACRPCTRSSCRVVEYPNPYLSVNTTKWTRHWYRLSIKLNEEDKKLTPEQRAAREDQKVKDISKSTTKESEVEWC
jgi:hypothetical protein